MTALTTAQILRKAVEIIRANGRHYVGFYGYACSEGEELQPEQCPVCVIGAIAIAVGLEPAWWNWEPDLRHTPEGRAAIRAALAFAAHVGLLKADPPHPDAVNLNNLIDALGSWHDGEHRRAPSDTELFAALEAAATHIETTEATR